MISWPEGKNHSLYILPETLSRFRVHDTEGFKSHPSPGNSAFRVLEQTSVFKIGFGFQDQHLVSR